MKDEQDPQPTAEAPEPLDVMRKAYQDAEFHFEEDEGTLTLRLGLKNLDVTVLCWGHAGDVASIIVRLPIRATEEFRAKTGEFLHRLNYAAKRKFWEMDYSDGEIRLVAYTDTITGPLTEGLFRSIFHAVTSTADVTFPYPAGTGDWHRSFVEKLNGRKNGLSILEGTPGTGKTFYLRHLMGHLKDTHRFYFIPPTSLKMLEEPEFIGFWSSQRETYSDRKLVVILEDADDALMTRETDNRDKVSAILNLSDGMLSDFLCLHVICTINCTAADIDQALLRPGRLVSHRVFKRLDVAQAGALAASLGKTLPQAQDYSLAEVFAEGETEVIPRPHMGFSA